MTAKVSVAVLLVLLVLLVSMDNSEHKELCAIQTCSVLPKATFGAEGPQAARRAFKESHEFEKQIQFNSNFVIIFKLCIFLKTLTLNELFPAVVDQTSRP